MNKIYAGIGSRETPKEVLPLLEKIAVGLDAHGWTLRTGGAEGADNAFWEGARWAARYGKIEVYLPWEGFNDFHKMEPSHFVARSEPQAEAFEIAAQFHPRWQYLKFGAKKLHARNVHQVLGFDVTQPELADCIICWTKGGKEVGGTAQALRIAKHYEIPIYNLGDPLTFQLLYDILGD